MEAFRSRVTHSFFLLFLSGVLGCGKGDTKSSVEFSLDVPVLAQTSQALEGMGELQATLEVDGTTLAGVRGGVRAGVRGGIRGGVRGEAAREPANREPVNRNDPAGSRHRGLTGSRKQAGKAEFPVYTVTYNFESLPSALTAGNHRLHPIFIRATDPVGQERGLCWFEFDKELTSGGAPRDPAIDPNTELFGIPDDDQDGVSNLVELALGTDPTNASNRPSVDEIKSEGFDATPPETTITSCTVAADGGSVAEFSCSETCSPETLAEGEAMGTSQTALACAVSAQLAQCGFRCKLSAPSGEGKVEVCRPGYLAKSSGAGKYTLSVRAIDGFGNADATSATCEWTEP